MPFEWGFFKNKNNIANTRIFPIDEMIVKSNFHLLYYKKIMDINNYQQLMEKAIAYLENEFK